MGVKVTIEIEDRYVGEVTVVRESPTGSPEIVNRLVADAAMSANRAMGYAGDHWPKTLRQYEVD